MTDGQSMRERFVRDHDRIAQIASEVTVMFSSPSPPDALMLSKARWTFASNLMQHLAIKERHLYAKLEADARREVTQAFACSKADLLRLFDQYTEYVEAWPTAEALSSWPSYRIKALAVVNTFVARLKKEEVELFDLVDRFGIDMSTPSPVTISWTRKAFELKAKVEDH